eukprot:512529_1
MLLLLILIIVLVVGYLVFCNQTTYTSENSQPSEHSSSTVDACALTHLSLEDQIHTVRNQIQQKRDELKKAHKKQQREHWKALALFQQKLRKLEQQKAEEKKRMRQKREEKKRMQQKRKERKKLAMAFTAGVVVTKASTTDWQMKDDDSDTDDDNNNDDDNNDYNNDNTYGNSYGESYGYCYNYDYSNDNNTKDWEEKFKDFAALKDAICEQKVEDVLLELENALLELDRIQMSRNNLAYNPFDSITDDSMNICGSYNNLDSIPDLYELVKTLSEKGITNINFLGCFNISAGDIVQNFCDNNQLRLGM